MNFFFSRIILATCGVFPDQEKLDDQIAQSEETENHVEFLKQEELKNQRMVCVCFRFSTVSSE